MRSDRVVIVNRLRRQKNPMHDCFHNLLNRAAISSIQIESCGNSGEKLQLVLTLSQLKS